MAPDAALRVDHHRPCQLGDLAGTKAGLDRQQDHDAMALWLSSSSASAWLIVTRRPEAVIRGARD
jgi:hypothetical protein